ncbi:c-type cytochrome [Sinorhizobium americanum]|uniref:Cytochrome c n=1 Tax=Sinorhizobium americanum TaxID=194963 RepID=A0A1L3LPW7_9HYPH|nr:cytochrome c family protein [Sinorhizobium americanum]APG85499.1 cytochrome c2 [Sinorhizobium americanum CCGM7]APG92158.1 cytochrome c2 [Sinorhizobium americanum]OAP34699.1 cytochrome C [Sinorhizobium americanum]TCN32606.1 cytochrome c [Sinorhizobium americanum]
MRIAVVALSFSALLLCPAVGQAQEGDAEAGATVFKKCSACHVVDKDQNRVGPSLMGVIGRTAGTHADFKYSNAMVDAGKNGLVWDEATLHEYLRDPKAKVKGTKMVFPGLKKDEEIVNVIAYLKQHPK